MAKSTKNKKRGFERVVFASDFHCGHRVGLTPPKYQTAIPGEKFYRAQVELWDWFAEAAKRIQPVDHLVTNGDLIDGLGERSRASELLTTDRRVQCKMAVECIEKFQAGKILCVRGTPYHTGFGEDWEDNIAKEVGAVKIGDHEWPVVNGVTFDVKHKVGASTIPHGRVTSLMKEWLWNIIWGKRGEQPDSDVIIRSHVHSYNGGFNREILSMTTPALQGMGSKFGARQCSGTVDFGFVYFDVYSNGDYQWFPEIAMVEVQKAKPIKL